MADEGDNFVYFIVYGMSLTLKVRQDIYLQKWRNILSEKFAISSCTQAFPKLGIQNKNGEIFPYIPGAGEL